MTTYLTAVTTILTDRYAERVQAGASGNEIDFLQSTLMDHAEWLEMALTPLVEYAP